jgi:hypothetical protein
MKRLIVLLIILLIPFNVFAETCDPSGITIQSIEMIGKSDGSNELNSAKANGTNINLDISFTKVNDYINYKLIIKNNTEDEYVLDESMFNKNYKNVEYKISSSNKTITAGSTKEIVLSVSLKNDATIGMFSETNSFDLELTGGKIVNPPTGVKSLLYFIPVLLILGFIVFYVSKKNRAFKTIAIILVFAIIAPTIVKAVCKCNIKIDSKVTVENCAYKIVTDIGSFEEDKDVKELCLGNDDVIDGSTIKINSVWSYYGMWDANNPTAFLYYRVYPKIIGPVFNDNSYIKVYSDENKTQLIKIITKSDVPSHYYYNLLGAHSADSDFIYKIGDYNKIYFTVSEDLKNKIMVGIGYGKSSEYHESSFTGEGEFAISNINIINKIEYLDSSFENVDIISFTNCENTQEDGGNTKKLGKAMVEPEKCTGTTYYAVWEGR